MADTTIYSEIAGTVWKVLVEVGDAVEAGVPLLLLESMKMEIPVVASDAGVVVEIFVVEGDSVAQGVPVLSIRC